MSTVREKRMKPDRRGFTMVEIAVVILIGAVLTTMAVRGFGNTTSTLAVNQARNAYNALHSRARAIAIERGSMARISVDEDGDSVWVTVDGTVVEKQYFGAQDGMDIDVRTKPAGTVEVCMTPRGFADPDCDNFSNYALIGFAQGDQWEVLQILPLGQVRW